MKHVSCTQSHWLRGDPKILGSELGQSHDFPPGNGEGDFPSVGVGQMWDGFGVLVSLSVR